MLQLGADAHTRASGLRRLPGRAKQAELLRGCVAAMNTIAIVLAEFLGYLNSAHR
jgi:hypothetical protein